MIRHIKWGNRFTISMQSFKQYVEPLTTVPSARVLKLRTVFGTTSPNRPITMRPISSSPILMSKYTYKQISNLIISPTLEIFFVY